MGVGTFIQPDFEAQTEGTEYKEAIDAATQVMARLAAMFAPHEQDTPNMTMGLDAGALFVDGAPVEKAAQSTGTITAPVSLPRIDRVVVDDATGVVSVITGAENANPVPPAIPDGKLPVGRLLLATTTTVITNDLITDERLPGLFGIAAPDIAAAWPVDAVYNEIANVNPATTLGFGTWEFLRQQNDGLRALLHFEGSGAAFVDDGPHAFPITAYNGATQSSTQKKVGSKSLACLGVNDYISIGGALSWRFGCGDFTISFWVYTAFSAGGENQMFRGPAGNFIRVKDGGTLCVCFQGIAEVDFGILASETTWYHICVTSIGGTVKVALDGVFHANSLALTLPFNDLNAALKIGGDGAGNYVAGYMDEVQIFDRAVWTQNFTPPTVVHPIIYQWRRTV